MTKQIKYLRLIEPTQQSVLSKVIQFLNEPRYIEINFGSVSGDEIKKKKIEALYSSAYDHFMTVWTTHFVKKIGDSVDFHPEYYAQRYAKRDATLNINRVIKEGRVNEFYSKLQKQVTV